MEFKTLLLLSIAALVSADITGTVTFDQPTNMIQQANVRYKFSIQGQNNFVPNGKVLIVFPSDFTFPSTFTNSSLVCINIGDSNKQLQCTFNVAARLLVMKINSTTFTAQKTLQFTVAGITNPTYAVQTGSFIIQNYYNDSSGNQQFEPSSDSFTITPLPGSLTQVSMVPANPTVGVTTSLTVTFTIQHALSANGNVVIQMPKWNPQAPSSSQMLSFIQASSSPGSVSCSPLSGVTSNIACLFTSGVSTDILNVTLLGVAGTQIASGTIISLTISNFLAPPSQYVVTGFQFQTTNSIGYEIDQGSGSVAATKPATMTGVTVSQSTSYRIFMLATVTLQIQNVNPIGTGSTLQITIPKELGVGSLTSVTATGGSFQTSPVWTSATNGVGQLVVTMKGINTAYINPSTYQYITFGKLRTPNTTLTTSSFQVAFLNTADGSVIEQITSGVTFQPVTGSIVNASVTTNSSTQTYINMPFVQYRFNFTPQDYFVGVGAQIKIKFPSQVSVNNVANANLNFVSPSSLLSLTNARVTVTQNKYALITGAFTKNYTTPTPLIFAIDGITNPSTTLTTDSFQISLFYTDGTNQVDVLTSGLTFVATANPNLGMQVLLASPYTGYDNQIQFLMNTPGSTFGISKGSYIVIGIPQDFQIYDTGIANSTCLAMIGFSDEISCSIQLSTANSGGHHILTITNGFSSKAFQGGYFSFNISEIRNPKNSKETGNFTVQIFDAAKNLQYSYTQNQITFMMTPAPFQYAMATSASPINGESADYTFTITLSVDTDVNAIVMINLPVGIEYDTSKNLTCGGLLNIVASQLRCVNKNNQQFLVYIWGNQMSVRNITNGTTISFMLGPFINPLSLQLSQSFMVSTFITSPSNTQYYYINSQDSGLSIQNTAKGNVYNLMISQVGQNSSQLNAKTSLRFQFITQTLIPSPNGIQVVITMPNNLVVVSSNHATINGQSVVSTFNAVSNQITLSLQAAPQNKSYDIVIYNAFINPSIGPYSYGGFIIDVQSSIGYSIDSITTNGAMLTVNCSSNCSSCNGYLSNCTQCSFNNALNTSFFHSLGNVCTTVCPSGFFADATDFTCKPCQYPCSQCSFGPQLCTQCFSNYSKPYANKQTLQCYSTCPTGTYLDKNQSLCVPCKSPCFTCSSATSCLSCSRDSVANEFYKFYSQEQQCFEDCPFGTLATPSNQCIDCLSPCQTCSQQVDQCVTCIKGYFLYDSNVCVEKCPQSYLTDINSMTCYQVGEMAFPFPFSILTVLITLGLIVARFMKNQTQFITTLLPLTDLTLKLNWVFLLIYLLYGQYYVSSLIIAYCLFANFVTNFLIWRFAFTHKGLDRDPQFKAYCLRYPCISTFLMFLSYTFSFHFVRLTYSKLFGKKCFQAHFTQHSMFQRLLAQVTLFSLVFVCIPAAIANSYNLHYVNSTQQVFYFDVDGLILVSFELILSLIVLVEKQQPNFLITESILSEPAHQMKLSFRHVDDKDSEIQESAAKALNGPEGPTFVDDRRGSHHDTNVLEIEYEYCDSVSNQNSDQPKSIAQKIVTKEKYIIPIADEGPINENVIIGSDQILTVNHATHKTLGEQSQHDMTHKTFSNIPRNFVSGPSMMFPTVSNQGVAHNIKYENQVPTGLLSAMQTVNHALQVPHMNEKEMSYVNTASVAPITVNSRFKSSVAPIVDSHQSHVKASTSIPIVGEPAKSQTNEHMSSHKIERPNSALKLAQQLNRPQKKKVSSLDLQRLQSMIMQLNVKSRDTESRINQEAQRKSQMINHLSHIREENECLLSEEERLKREIEDIRSRLEEFNRITVLEIRESESVRKQRNRVHIVNDYASSNNDLEQEDEILQDNQHDDSPILKEKKLKKKSPKRSPKSKTKKSPKSKKPLKNKKSLSPKNKTKGITVLDKEGPKFLNQKTQDLMKSKQEEMSDGSFKEERGSRQPDDAAMDWPDDGGQRKKRMANNESFGQSPGKNRGNNLSMGASAKVTPLKEEMEAPRGRWVASIEPNTGGPQIQKLKSSFRAKSNGKY